jgi:hypothetical protein
LLLNNALNIEHFQGKPLWKSIDNRLSNPVPQKVNQILNLERRHRMIISDLSHLEAAKQSPSVVGGWYSYSYSNYKSNSSYIDQYASSKATAKSFLSSATAVAISTNDASVYQIN